MKQQAFLLLAVCWLVTAVVAVGKTSTPSPTVDRTASVSPSYVLTRSLSPSVEHTTSASRSDDTASASWSFTDDPTASRSSSHPISPSVSLSVDDTSTASKSKTPRPTPSKSLPATNTQTASAPSPTLSSDVISNSTTPSAATASMTLTHTVSALALSGTDTAPRSASLTPSESTVETNTTTIELTRTATAYQRLRTNAVGTYLPAAMATGAVGVFGCGPAAILLSARLALVTTLPYCAEHPSAERLPFPLAPWPGFTLGSTDDMAGYRGAVVAAIVTWSLAVAVALSVGTMRSEMRSSRGNSNAEERPQGSRSTPQSVGAVNAGVAAAHSEPAISYSFDDVDRRGWLTPIATVTGMALAGPLLYCGCALLVHPAMPSDAVDSTFGFVSLIFGCSAVLLPCLLFARCFITKDFAYWPHTEPRNDMIWGTSAAIVDRRVAARAGLAVLNARIPFEVAQVLELPMDAAYQFLPRQHEMPAPWNRLPPAVLKTFVEPRGQWFARASERGAFPFQYRLLRPQSSDDPRMRGAEMQWRRFGVIALAPYRGRPASGLVKSRELKKPPEGPPGAPRKHSVRGFLLHLAWSGTPIVDLVAGAVLAVIVGSAPAAGLSCRGATIATAVVLTLCAIRNGAMLPLRVVSAQAALTLAELALCVGAWLIVGAGPPPDPAIASEVRAAQPYYDAAAACFTVALVAAVLMGLLALFSVVVMWHTGVELEPYLGTLRGPRATVDLDVFSAMAEVEMAPMPQAHEPPMSPRAEGLLQLEDPTPEPPPPRPQLNFDAAFEELFDVGPAAPPVAQHPLPNDDML